MGFFDISLMFNTRFFIVSLSIAFVSALLVANAVTEDTGLNSNSTGIAVNSNHDSIADISSVLCAGFHSEELAECESLLHEESIAPPRPDAETIAATQTYSEAGDTPADSTPPPSGSNGSGGGSSGSGSNSSGSSSGGGSSSYNPTPSTTLNETEENLNDSTPAAIIEIPAQPIETQNTQIESQRVVTSAISIPEKNSNVAPSPVKAVAKAKSKNYIQPKALSESIPTSENTQTEISSSEKTDWQPLIAVRKELSKQTQDNILQTFSIHQSAPSNNNLPVENLTVIMIVLLTLQSGAISIFYLVKAFSHIK